MGGILSGGVHPGGNFRVGVLWVGGGTSVGHPGGGTSGGSTFGRVNFRGGNVQVEQLRGGGRDTFRCCTLGGHPVWGISGWGGGGGGKEEGKEDLATLG